MRLMIRRLLLLLPCACGPSLPPGTTDGGASSTGTTTSATTSSTATTSSSATSPPTTTGAPDTTSTGVTTTTATTVDVSGTTTSNTTTSGDPPRCFDSVGTGEFETSTGDDTTTGDPVVCGPIEGLACTAPIDCTDQFCGSQSSALDEHGCPRAFCAKHSDCAPGEVCSIGGAWGGIPECVEQNGSCTCTLKPAAEIGVCVPDVTALCATLTSEADCEQFHAPAWDYCEWTAIEQLCPDGGCSSRTIHRCLLWSYHGDGCAAHCDGGSRVSYTREGPLGPELIVDGHCEDDPVGWDWCDGGNDEVCQCACAMP